MNAEDSDSEQELFPIEHQEEIFSTFVYEDPLLVSGILRAVVSRDLEKIKKLISEGKSVNINDNNGNTPLHVAIIKEYNEIVDYLVSLEDITINSRNFYGETPLFQAIRRGNYNLAETLIKAKCNVNLSNHEDISPLHIAVRYPQIAQLLIENGANLNASDYSGETPLHEAINEGILETVFMLLFYNADANAHCENDITPFMKSIILQRIEIQEILLPFVDDFNVVSKEGMTLLNLALTHDCPFVEEIINGGADVNYQNKVLNVFHMCLQVPNVKNFTLIWQNFHYQPLYEPIHTPYIEALLHALDVSTIYQYLDVVIESGNISPLFEGSSLLPYLKFVYQRVTNKASWYEITTKLVCSYLCCGNILLCESIDYIFELYGRSTLLNICLYMDIEIPPKSDDSDDEIYFISRLMTRLFYDITWTVDDFKFSIDNDIFVQDIFDHPERYLLYFKVPDLRYNVPLFYRNYQLYKVFCQIPSLLELARNKSREHIVKHYSIRSSKEYYQFMKTFNIPSIYKDILLFMKPIYTLD